MNLRLSSPNLIECLKEFEKLVPEDRLSMSVYDLAEFTDIKDYTRWIEFMKEPAVAEAIDEELNLYIDAQKRKLIQTTTIDDKSVGKAQLITALTKANEGGAGTGGNLFVYNYIPLNENERKRPNVVELDLDIMDTD